MASPNDQDEWEVERIVDHCERPSTRTTEYLIKWVGFSDVYNTWEPARHLANCKEKLREYKSKLKRKGRKRKELSPPPGCTGAYLQKWENKLNMARGHDAPIRVENHVDDVMPPDKFVYVTKNILGHGVPEPEEGVVIGCSCHGNCSESKLCCPQLLHNSKFPYTENGLIRLDPGKAVVECNKKCVCDGLCTSRVVQKGRQIEVCIFRTDNGRGWGLKTLIDIKAKQFVTEYVGEVVTTDEAEERGKLYDEQGSTYLMDLDFNEDKEAEFSIDGKYYGNASRFINHSCGPNLIAYGCWIDNPDIRLPRIGLFAVEDISAGEELTIDYLMSPMDSKKSPVPVRKCCSSPNTPPPTPLSTKKSPQRQRKRIQCKCRSKNCRTVLF